MTSQQILQSDLLDILFEKRNKDYGAYRLRRDYSVELIKALGITLLLVLLLIFVGGPSAPKGNVGIIKDGYEITPVDIVPNKPEPPKPKVQPAPVQPAVKQNIFLTNLRAVDHTKEPVATQADLSQSIIGSVKTDGAAFTGIQPQLPPAPGSGNGKGLEEEEHAAPPLPSRQPQFPGGTDAWIRFLQHNLVPPAEMEGGETRSVLIRFWVDEEGAVTNFQVVKSGGDAFDNEVIRVLKRMPRWLPAVQSGRPVAVSFTQPVTFTAAE